MRETDEGSYQLDEETDTWDVIFYGTNDNGDYIRYESRTRETGKRTLTLYNNGEIDFVAENYPVLDNTGEKTVSKSMDDKTAQRIVSAYHNQEIQRKLLENDLILLDTWTNSIVEELTFN